MAARAIHNVFKMSEFQLVITSDAVRCVLELHFKLYFLLYLGRYKDYFGNSVK